MNNTLPPVVRRFLRYVRIDTQSDPHSGRVPSTEKQKDLSRLLMKELHEIGIKDACMTDAGIVYGTIPGHPGAGDGPDVPVLALLAHVDTAPDAPGGPVHPIIHRNYDGRVIHLPADPAVSLDPARQPSLLDHLGEDLISGDGKTLLGSDDKAGVALLMQLAEDFTHETNLVRPAIRLCFTTDEEVGRGVDHVDLETLGADVAYTIDGSGMGTIAYETFFAAEAKLHIEGIMVHPGYAKDVMVNAIRIGAEFVAALPALESPEATQDRQGYLHPTHFVAEDASKAVVELILRDFSSEGLARRKQLLEQQVAFLQSKHLKAALRIEIRDQYKNMRSYIENTDRRVIDFAHEAARKIGMELKVEKVRGGTDGARLSEMGLPTPNIFNGGYDYHSCFEWNTIQNLVAALDYLKALAAHWGEHGAAS